tara:strand:+ start:3801 stop:4832 length:1032 start_codon:yes stop_codon:yes gene_type:complete
MSSNTGLIDALTLRQILIERLSKGESKRLLKHLKRLSAELKKTIINDYGRVRAVRLADKVSKITTTILAEYGDDLAVGLKEFAKGEAEFARQTLLETTSAKAISAPTVRQIQAAITKVPMKLLGSKGFKSITVNQAVSQFTKKKSVEIANIIKDGATTGKTSQELVKNITGLINTRTRNQAESLVRTTTNHIGNRARAATYEANEDVIDGEEYVSTLDSSTTITCAGFDGEIFPINEGPMPPLHWGCRSIRVPSVNPKFNIGSKITGERSSVDGPVSAKITYGGWLKRQNSDVQDEVLGVERGKIFRSGKLSIKKFTDKTGKIYTLDRLKELNPLTFKSASST